MDENGDYVFGRRDHFLTGAAAVGQAIKTRLLMCLAEWWEDIEGGTPWREEIIATFQSEDTLAGIDIILSERITGTPGVTEIVSYDSSFNVGTRVYSASCVVNTEYGDALRVEIGPSSNTSPYYTVKTYVKGVAA